MTRPPRENFYTALSTSCEPTRIPVDHGRPGTRGDASIGLFVQVRRGFATNVAGLTPTRSRGMSSPDAMPGDVERNKVWAPGAILHPQAAQALDTEGLTLFDASAYRWPVTRCRPVPHVHGKVTSVGGRCQPNQWHSTVRSTAVTAPDTPWREAREQAYVPAEQPSPSQGARIPSPHADSRRPRDSVDAPSQGPQEPGRLTASLSQASSTPCCPRPIGSGTATPFVPRSDAVDGRVRAPWWCTSTRPRAPRSQGWSQMAPPASASW